MWKDKRLLYAITTMTYGALHKVSIMKDAKIYDTVSYDRTYPILTTQKALVVGAGALSSIYLWPLYLFVDVMRLEVHSRGLKDTDYLQVPPKRPTSIIDFLLA